MITLGVRRNYCSWIPDGSRPLLIAVSAMITVALVAPSSTARNLIVCPPFKEEDPPVGMNRLEGSPDQYHHIIHDQNHPADNPRGRVLVVC